MIDKISQTVKVILWLTTSPPLTHKLLTFTGGFYLSTIVLSC